MEQNNSNTEKYKFQIINIKLQTNKTGVQKLQAYENLIKKLQELKIHSSVEENVHMIIYSCYERNTEISQTKFLYGRLGKGIYFERGVADSLNIEKSQEEKIETNKNQILEPKITDYIFIPAIHRFVMLNTNGISIKNVYKFLKDNLSLVADKEDIIEIEIIKDPKITDEILQAYQIHTLDYSISYTNDDITSSTEKHFDERLKKLRIGTFNAKMQADNNGAFNMEEPDELIEGGIRLAEQNGQINEATITRKRGEEKIKLSNKERPRHFDIESEDYNFREKIVAKVLKIFRKDNE